jgi:ribonuclease P protein component
VLPLTNRLRTAEDFRHVVRRGRRSGGPLLVVHVSTANVDKTTSSPVRAGFVVAKSVGQAVTRNKVKRRLRHLVRDRLDTLPAGSMLVVRALPASAGAAYGDLAAELDRCLVRGAEALS